MAGSGSARLLGAGYWVLAVLLGLSAHAAALGREPFADAQFVPPAKSSALPLMPADSVRELLGFATRAHIFNLFEGKTDALRARFLKPGHGNALQGGEAVSVDLAEGDLLQGPTLYDGSFWWSASVASVDAAAIRLRVDLAALPVDAQAWVIDPVRLEAFGPYTAGEGSRWLSTVFGEEAVLMVRTSGPDIPGLRLIEYGHIFLGFAEAAKNLACNIDIGCETDTAILSIAAGTGIILVGGSWFCSGTLLNNALTPEYEPFFLTANHCVCTGQNARDTEVYWDFRSSGCGTNDAPDLTLLPRSRGTALLATDSQLDATLIRLDSVPSGPLGRTYAGWDSRELNPGEGAMTIHYADALQMRETKGTIVKTGISQNGRKQLVETHWDEGVTESGSSGACLLMSSNLRIVGTLSQGPQHSCGSDRSGNVDYFGSFRHFYPEISKYVDSATVSTEVGEDDCRKSSSSCFLTTLFGENALVLDDFRILRDKMLACGPAGRWAVDFYYLNGPAWAHAVETSELLREVCFVAAAPLARLGAFIDSVQEAVARLQPIGR